MPVRDLRRRHTQETLIKKHRAFSGRRRTRRNKATQFGLVNCNNFTIINYYYDKFSKNHANRAYFWRIWDLFDFL